MQAIKNPWLLLAIIAVLGWLSVRLSFSPVQVVGDDNVGRFSAERAHAYVRALIPDNIPHPSGSEENLATRGRIIDAFSALNIDTSLEEEMVCRGLFGFSVNSCANVTNIIAPIKAGTGKPIILMAHYDSVAAGPGAADDIHGVATILEVARLIQSDKGFTNPVIGLITDGEEDGLFGARAYFQKNDYVKAAGIVINIEARGNQGPSLLFETSEDAGWLVDVFAKNASKPMTNSLMRAAYKVLPNDTDLSESLDAGVPGLNFAFAGNVAHYHTSLDTPENLSLESMQHQGDNVLAIVRALKAVDFDQAPKGDTLYIDILSRFVVSVPTGFLWPFIAVSLALMALHAWFANERPSPSVKSVLGGILFVPLLLVGAAAMALGVSFLTGIFGEPAPGFADPTPYRVSLYFGSWATLAGLSILMARWLSPRAIHYSVWGWTVVLSAIMAVYAEGAAVVFIFPALIAAILCTRLDFTEGRVWSSFLSSIIMLILWAPLVYLFELMFGLNLPPVISVVAVLAVIGFAPLIAYWASGATRGWIAPFVGVVAAAGFAIITAQTPSFNEQKPLGLNVIHLTDDRDDTVEWRLRGRSANLLPDEMRAAAEFGDEPKAGIPFLLPGGYAAPARAADNASSIAVLGDAVSDDIRKVQVNLRAPNAGGRMAILIPKEAKPVDAVFEVSGEKFDFIEDGTFQNYHILTCSAGDCGRVEISLASTAPQKWLKLVTKNGVPDFAEPLLTARPKWAVPYQGGDVTVTIHEQEI